MSLGVGVLVDSVSREPVGEDTVKVDTPHFFGHWLYRESGMFLLNVRNIPEIVLLYAKRHSKHSVIYLAITNLTMVSFYDNFRS